MCFFLFLIGCFFIPFDVYAMTSYADIVEDLMPSIVNISTEKETLNKDDDIDNVQVIDEFSMREALGSGFIIRKEGYVLTNAHVIRGSKTVKIITNNNTEFETQIIGIDEPSDLAVLKIKIPDKKNMTFKPVNFGNADDVRIGDIVLAFGNPYGVGVSVSHGIISAKSRQIGLGEQAYLQTDAAINQGNSGGPMFNLDGEVIGVNTFILQHDGATGIGFSLPSNMANWISSQLIDTGKVRRGWLGMDVSYGVDKYTDKPGLVVTEINEESNAYKEGVRVGDIILKYNDREAINLADFMHFTETMDIGQALRLTVLNYGEEVRHVIRIQEMPQKELKKLTNKALKEREKFSHEESNDNIFYISELKIAVKEASPRGLKIVKIDKKSPLWDKGLKEGNIIIEADRTDIYSVDNILDSIKNAVADDVRAIDLLIQDLDNTFYAHVKPVVEYD